MDDDEHPARQRRRAGQQLVEPVGSGSLVFAQLLAKLRRRHRLQFEDTGWPHLGRGAILEPVSDRARKLLQDALELPLPERAELAADLLASLDGEPDKDVEDAWAAEIERRARDAVTNPEDDIAWETIRAELHAEPSGE